MPIASLGGTEVSKSGARNTPGSGGKVGGLSLPGGNWAYWTGAGKSYESFSPNSSSMATVLPSQNPQEFPIDADIDFPSTPPTPRYDRSGGTSVGGGSVGGGSSPSPIPNFPQPSGTLPSWLQGSYTGAGPQGQNISLTFGSGGSVTANFGNGQLVQQGYVYQQNGNWYLWLANNVSQILNTAFGFITQGGGQSISYYGYSQPAVVDCFQDCDSPTETPIENPTKNPILDVIGGLITPTPRTNVESTPPYFAFNPQQGGQGASMNYTQILVIGALVVGVYLVYKKYAK